MRSILKTTMHLHQLLKYNRGTQLQLLFVLVHVLALIEFNSKAVVQNCIYLENVVDHIWYTAHAEIITTITCTIGCFRLLYNTSITSVFCAIKLHTLYKNL